MGGYRTNTLRIGVNDKPLEDWYPGETSLRIDSNGNVYVKPFGEDETMLNTAEPGVSAYGTVGGTVDLDFTQKYISLHISDQDTTINVSPENIVVPSIVYIAMWNRHQRRITWDSMFVWARGRTPTWRDNHPTFIVCAVFSTTQFYCVWDRNMKA